MEYYLVLKRTELSCHEKTCRNLKCILLSEKSQSEKATYYMIPTTRHCGKSKPMKTMKNISGCWGLWEECMNKWSTEDI